MTGFEFKLLSANETADFEKALNAAGAEGFDIAQVIPGDGCWFALMKRAAVSRIKTPVLPNSVRFTPVTPITPDATKTAVFPQGPSTFQRKPHD
jgi:hypothetical protein